MSFPFIYTLILIILMSFLLLKEWLSPEITVFGTLIFLLIGKVVTVEEAFTGFSNIGVISIGLLFVVAGALYSSGALNYINRFLLGKPSKSNWINYLRILGPVSTISAFSNNTPIVALLIPSIRSWAEKYDISISKYLIPLSFATILGGMCTLIGTSTNLIIHGLLIDSGRQGYSFFEISRIGVPAAVVGLIFLILFSYRMLPTRKEPLVSLGEKTRDFVIELKVTPDYQNIGKTIEKAGLRHLTGLFLFQIERQNRIIAPAKPDEILQEADRLFFTGLPKTILELQKTPGLQLIKESSFDLKYYDSDEIKTYEAVISSSAPLIGKNVRESNFREKYGAVIIAIHRNGHRINKKIGDIVLLPGDTLLLLADKNFRKKWYHSNDFYLISDTFPVPSKPKWQGTLSIVIFVMMILLVVSEIMPLVTAASFSTLVLILSRTISPGDAKNMVDWKVLIIIASALGITHAIENSGVASVLGNRIVETSQHLGILGTIIGVYLLTSLYTTIITNNATAALLFPVGIAAATALQADLKPFILAVTIAAAASFATPISYQTNLMVYGPGGYKFSDFLKIGIPLQLLVGVVAITAIYFFYF